MKQIGKEIIFDNIKELRFFINRILREINSNILREGKYESNRFLFIYANIDERNSGYSDEYYERKFYFLIYEYNNGNIREIKSFYNNEYGSKMGGCDYDEEEQLYICKNTDIYDIKDIYEKYKDKVDIIIEDYVSSNSVGIIIYKKNDIDIDIIEKIMKYLGIDYMPPIESFSYLEDSYK